MATKIVVDWLALRDSIEIHLRLLFVETLVSEENIRWMTNHLIQCVRSGAEFKFPEETQAISPMHKAAVRGLIAGSTLAIKYTRTA